MNGGYLEHFKVIQLNEAGSAYHMYWVGMYFQGFMIFKTPGMVMALNLFKKIQVVFEVSYRIMWGRRCIHKNGVHM